MWNRIKNYEGETFHTVSGLPFTYKVIDDNTIRSYRDDTAGIFILQFSD